MNDKMTQPLCLALCAAFALAFGATNSARSQTNAPATIQPPPPRTALRGRQLFMSDNCYLCHGTVGQGGAGPTIAPPRLMSQSAFSAYVRRPQGHMPPYTQTVLSDADLAAIYDYLQSLPPPATVPKLLSSELLGGRN
jgi:mono/diheme cytochrome c family protein